MIKRIFRTILVTHTFVSCFPSTYKYILHISVHVYTIDKLFEKLYTVVLKYSRALGVTNSFGSEIEILFSPNIPKRIRDVKSIYYPCSYLSFYGGNVSCICA